MNWLPTCFNIRLRSESLQSSTSAQLPLRLHLSIPLMLIAFFLNVQVYAREVPVRSLLEMRHSNVVIQNWDLSCGAAALTTLLNYQHGENLTEKEVALALMNRLEYLEDPELIQVREGFSLLDLKRYADARGYKGVGLGKLELKDLVSKAPIIVAIQTRDYNHFVIFRGMEANRVLLADPAWGNRTMLVDDFLESWIEYPQIGRVGFAVERQDKIKPVEHALEPKAHDYVMLR